MTTSLDVAREQAVREFTEIKCPVCGQPKKRKQSFCSPCYIHLPLDMQRALWKGFGRGYEEAYQAAREWLLKPENKRS